jgi:polyphosphate kinase
VDALIDAAEAGKQVVVVVEIKARFDERANVAWAKRLEEAGCHVVYGFVEWKTHAKVALVVREEQDGMLRRYVHIGTGNYNPTTARLYEDFGLLTADPTVAEDVTDLFNHLTAYSRKSVYQRLLVAPEGLRFGLIERIEHQTERARAGLPALIRFKCNSLTDEAVMDALYRSSQAGVPVDLWIRGICSLRPGIPGLSENIRVRSILGRFLEHARIYAFGPAENGGAGARTADPAGPRAGGRAPGPALSRAAAGTPEVWLGSSDLMHRNLDRRVETLVRVGDRGHQKTLRDLLAMAMDDSTASWWLGPDGLWTRHHLAGDGTPLRDLQAYLVQIRRGKRPVPEAADGPPKPRQRAEPGRAVKRPSRSGGTGPT